MSDNKLVKIIMDSAALTGIAAGIGWIAKKVFKENFTPYPSSNVNRKEMRKLTFRALAFRRSKSRNCGLCVVYIQKDGATLLVGAW